MITSCNEQDIKEEVSFLSENKVDRQQEIRDKGFSFGGRRAEYATTKLGPKVLDDAIMMLGTVKKINRSYGDKATVLKHLNENNLKELREISKYYYNTNGIYRRICEYFAYLYRYDWYIVPEIFDSNVKQEKVLKDFNKLLGYLDNSCIQKSCGDIALKVVKNGVFYGVITDTDNGVFIQELPINYCRSRYSKGVFPVIEFNMKYFDDNFRDIAYRMKVLKMFPKDIQKGYTLFRQNKLPAETPEDGQGGWYLIDPEITVKFDFNGSEIPVFASAIPALLDLDAAQELDRRKQMQKLLKIIVQKLPMDKNGDLIFDIDEATDIHNNAVQMLKKAIGVDILTTFTDVDSIDLSDKNTATSVDDLDKVERALYNAIGSSRNIFNTDGNLSLEKSILNDESSGRNLLLQFEMFYNRICKNKNPDKKKYNFRLYFLETTQYNYKELSKMYKEQVQIGYSKMLPQIAMGHSQNAIINSVYFENEVLNLSSIMIPPLMSSTLNGEDVLGKKDKTGNSKTQKVIDTSENKGGREELPDDQKSEKTIQNRESMN